MVVLSEPAGLLNRLQHVEVAAEAVAAVVEAATAKRPKRQKKHTAERVEIRAVFVLVGNV